MEQQPAGPQRPQHPLANYHFSTEELRVLRECNVESFFQRSIPFGISLGVGAFLGVKNGYLKPNVKYGSAPKVVVGVVLGYFLGKFSYQQKCAEKMMQLPNSRLGELLRRRKQDPSLESYRPDQNLGVGLALSPFTPSTNSFLNDPPQQSSSLDMERQNSVSELDDMYRPSLDTSTNYLETDLPITPVKPGVTYDELRKKNRDEYNVKQQSILSRPSPVDSPIASRQQPLQGTVGDTQGEKVLQKIRVNKYGDVVVD